MRRYVDTPAVSTAERLPTKTDGTVLAREHLGRNWWPTRWSEVTRRTHAEWRTLIFTDTHRARMRAWDKASKAK